MEQLIIHLFGDYFTQSDWQALNKSKKTLNCLIHCILYTLCFLVLTTSWKALLFIGMTHFIIDRFPVIVKRIIWLKNHINPQLSYMPFEYCDTTGYYDDCQLNTKKIEDEIKEFQPKLPKPRPVMITIWLYIISDNTLHLLCNFIALKYLV